jgi:hypothetical protein
MEESAAKSSAIDWPRVGMLESMVGNMSGRLVAEWIRLGGGAEIVVADVWLHLDPVVVFKVVLSGTSSRHPAKQARIDHVGS